MAKKTEEESLENQLKNRLKEFSIEEIESYLELLLTKCLEAIEKEDLTSYYEIEKTLNSSIIFFSSTVRNFNVIYNAIKLRVANKFLRKQFNNNPLTVIEEGNTKGSFLTVEEAEKILQAEEYLKYTTAKNNVKRSLEPSELYSNKRYSITSEDSYFYTIFDKVANYYVQFEAEGTSEILKAFVTKDSILLKDMEKKLLDPDITPEEIAEEEAKLKKETYTIGLEEHISFRKDNNNYLEDTIYYNENNVFLAYVTKWGVVIYHKRTGTKIELIMYTESWFTMDFVTFCMGKAGSLINEMKDPNFKK